MPKRMTPASETSSLTPEQLIAVSMTLLAIVILWFSLVKLTHVLFSVMMLACIVVLVMYILWSPVGYIEKYLTHLTQQALRRPSKLQWRIPAILIVYAAVVLGTLGFVVQLLPAFQTELQNFSQDLPRYYNHLDKVIQSVSHGNLSTEDIVQSVVTTPPQTDLRANTPPDLLGTPPASVSSPQSSPLIQSTEPILTSQPQLHTSSQPIHPTTPENAMAQLTRFIRHVVTQLFGDLFNLGRITLSSLLYLFMGAVLTFYLLLDGAKLRQGLAELFPKTLQPEAEAFLIRTHQRFLRFTQLQLLFAVLSGIYLSGLYLLFGVPYAGVMGFMYGLFSLIPALGPLIGFIPGLLIILFGNTPTDLFLIILLTFLFHFVKERWLRKQLGGHQLGVHPVVVVVVFMVCLRLAGFWGLLLTFPVLAFLAGIHPTDKQIPQESWAL